MSYNDLPEKMREAIYNQFDVLDDNLEFAAAILIESVDEDMQRDSDLASALNEIIREADVELVVNEDRVGEVEGK